MKGDAGNAQDADERARERTFLLPGVGEIAHVHGYETEYLYEEIFGRQAYVRHGVSLQPGDNVVDIGANIGMFTLFVHHLYPGVHVYAFEPAPPPFAALAKNVSRYCPGSRAFNYAVSDRDGVAPFTFYVNSTVFSSFCADPGRDSETLRTIVENALYSRIGAGSLDLRPVVDRLLRDRLASTVYPCATKTLSTVVRQEGLDRIDLLKIDTEGNEIPVLQGIDDEHWERIRQVVLEVHDRGNERAIVIALLEDRGFHVTVDEPERLLRGTALTSVFARRPDTAAPVFGDA